MLNINWMPGLMNLPSIQLEEDLALLPREECEFTFKNGMWYHIQRNGIVRYFAHSGLDRNEGGFGGATFDILFNNEPLELKGPWSSRASMINTILPDDKQIADITLDNGQQHKLHIGILVSELVSRWNFEEEYLLRSIPHPNDKHMEQGSFTASLAPDCILKPDATRIDKSYDYEVMVGPKNV